MLSIACAPRRESLLRCAFCHDDLFAAELWTCGRCATCLHPECQAEARRCPTLGCGSRIELVLQVIARAPGATLHHLFAALLSFGGAAFVLLFIAPRITKIFEKKKQSLPVPTTVLVELMHLVGSTPGLILVAGAVAAMIFAYVKYKRRPATRYALDAVVGLSVIFVPFALFGVVLPLVNMNRV